MNLNTLNDISLDIGQRSFRLFLKMKGQNKCNCVFIFLVKVNCLHAT